MKNTKRKKWLLSVISFLLLLPVIIASVMAYQEIQKAQRNYALIAAVKKLDTLAVLGWQRLPAKAHS